MTFVFVFCSFQELNQQGLIPIMKIFIKKKNANNN